MIRRLFILCLFALPLLAGPAAGWAQPSTPAASGRDAAATAAKVETDEARIARQIDALIAGTLGADVDAGGLFSTDLGSANAAVVRSIVAMVGDGALFQRARQDPSSLEALSPDQARLAIAAARFLRLPRKRQEQILADHSEKVAGARRKENEKAREQAELAALREKIAQLEAFLGGKPVEGGALAVDLVADLQSLRVGTPAEDAAEPNSRNGLQARLTRLRRDVLALPHDRLAALEEASGIGAASMAAARAAELQMRDAAQQAQDARNERERIVASEQARLFGTKAAQDRFAVTIDQIMARPVQIQEDALAWRRQVRDIQTMSGDRGALADSLYQRLVVQLQAIRGQLRNSLATRNHRIDPAIQPQPLDDAVVSGLVDAPGLVKLHAELTSGAVRLVSRQAEAEALEQEALRDAMVLVNQSRLDLIPYLSAEKRSAVLGFGGEGLAQVSREISQISLDLRFQLANWRQKLRAAIEPFRHPTPSTVTTLVAVVAAILFLRWWRRRGGDLLLAHENALRMRQPRTLGIEAQATVLGYIRRVGAPIDWMVFILLLRWLIPAELQPAGFGFVWIVATYSVAAWLMARLTNELVRGRRAADPRAELRLKSLSLVIGVAFVFILILALTRESVGKGAIHNWILTFCWLAAVPLLLVLSHWWRDRIVALAGASDERGSFLRWVARDPGGIVGLIGRVAAGTVLLIEGARLAFARRIRDFALVRELFEYRERAVAARQAAEDKASGRYSPLPAETLDLLDPERLPRNAARPTVLQPDIDLTGLPGGTICCIVGDRGLGKSATLHGLGHLCTGEEGNPVRICVDARGYDGIIADLGDQLCPGQVSPGEEALVGALTEHAGPHPQAILIDDLQRLAIPAIGGLDDLDRLIALARRCGDACVWIMTIGTPAWHFVSRARFDRALFDKVEHLAKWSFDDLRALIDRRSEQAGIVPEFGDLTDMGAYQFDGDLTPDERKRAAYFDRLFEYAHGNPAIALEFWRRSLFIDTTTQKSVVRTFATPQTQGLLALPSAAMFVLRTLLQTDGAEQTAVERSTDLAPSVVSDAIRGLERLGVIAQHGTSYRITMFWLPEVIRALQRQNLIVSS